MHDKPEDTPTIGERMNRGMGLDPGFTLDRPALIDALREGTDATMKRAQANVEQQRQNAADVEEIANDMKREAQDGIPPEPEPEPDEA